MIRGHHSSGQSQLGELIGADDLDIQTLSDASGESALTGTARSNDGDHPPLHYWQRGAGAGAGAARARSTTSGAAPVARSSGACGGPKPPHTPTFRQRSAPASSRGCRVITVSSGDLSPDLS